MKFKTYIYNLYIKHIKSNPRVLPFTTNWTLPKQRFSKVRRREKRLYVLNILIESLYTKTNKKI